MFGGERGLLEVLQEMELLLEPEGPVEAGVLVHHVGGAQAVAPTWRSDGAHKDGRAGAGGLW